MRQSLYSFTSSSTNFQQAVTTAASSKNPSMGMLSGTISIGETKYVKALIIAIIVQIGGSVYLRNSKHCYECVNNIILSAAIKI